ncbi:hypothetical protein ACF3MZ_13085 [Paenibacillaceae bacterium WGS1546]|uniref:hypothetical protein n=1 Tax=Cohnella sp. WGS1546 TaxID=3366810 RepID=UPI00372CFF8A
MPENAAGKREGEGKRSYTLAILYVIIVVLLTLIILSYSKYILERQAFTTFKGQKLAERFAYAQVFADRLHDGAEAMLAASTDNEKIRAAALLAEGRFAGGETLGLFIEARSLDSGLKRTEVTAPLMEAFNAVAGAESPLAAILEGEGPLTEEQISFLASVRDAMGEMEELLLARRPPTGEVGFRQMITLKEWVPDVLEAVDILTDLSGELNVASR